MDDPSHPTFALVQDLTESTYIGGVTTPPALRDAFAILRPYKEVVVCLWPDDPLPSALPPEPYYQGVAIDFTDRSPAVDLSRLAVIPAVRHFMLADVGNLGFTPVRDLGPFEPARFKQWAAWQVGARGRRAVDQMQWMIFYAPEVNKTFVIGTTVVSPPSGIDPHAVLRDSFEVDPAVQADGVAPEPLPELLPAPELISPTLGARFVGAARLIVLRWQAVQELAKDEYYAVLVEYDYGEATNDVTFTTQETQITLPETLYRTPNCGVFNWQVTLMRQTGVDEAGQPVGVPIGYNSLYWYVQWLYPPGESSPFPSQCPNPQF